MKQKSYMKKISNIFDWWDELREEVNELNNEIKETEDSEKKQELMSEVINIQKIEKELQAHLSDMRENFEEVQQVQANLQKQVKQLGERTNTISSILDPDFRSN